MSHTEAAWTCDDQSAEAACVAAPEAASVAASGRMRPERIEVVLSSDRRREHAPELRARLVSEMMSGRVIVSELSRREGICASVLHRWLRQARIAMGKPVSPAPTRLVPVRMALSVLPEVARSAPMLEVVLGNGRLLRVPPGADPAVVAQLVTALEGSPVR